MSKQDYEITVEFGFSFGEHEYRGELILLGEGKDLQINIRTNKPMRPLDLEKALYQIAHIIAEKTQTKGQLRREKINIWT